MGTKANPSAHDCYANAEPDEPLFILLARDRHAPALVWLWAVLRELDGESPEKVKEARDCAVAMIGHAAERGRKSVGVAQSVLAGLLELIRSANHAAKDFENAPTDLDQVRLFLCAARFEPAAAVPPPKEG